MADGFSDYIVFADESGDHGMESIDPAYPVFVLAFCILKKDDYASILGPALQKFKLKHFGHDSVVLHERDIRKDSGNFSFLKDERKKADFLEELTGIIEALPFTLVCTVIRKDLHRQRYVSPLNPYNIAMEFGLERVFGYLRDMRAHVDKTHIVVECRGRREDNDLELEFRRVCDGANFRNEKYPFIPQFVEKKSNSAGLQIADLIARPVGVSVHRPDQQNRAFDVIRTKFYSANGRYQGLGLKCFP
jgi:hypothetical protein